MKEDFMSDPFGNQYKRIKYERQQNFRNRVANEYRKILLKQISDVELSFKDYNIAIIQHPIRDMKGFTVLRHVIEHKDIIKSGVKSKFIKLKMRLEE